MNHSMMDELEDAWHELDDDPAVRVIVNTGEGKSVPDRPRRRRAESRQGRNDRAVAPHRDAELRFTAWHYKIWKPVIAAVNGTVAGGGLHFVADADIVIAASDATFFDTHVSLGQVTVVRGDRADRQDGVGADHAHGVGRALRAHLGGSARTQLGMISQIVDPPEQSARGGAGAGGEDGQELARGDAGHQEARCGARWRWASATRRCAGTQQMVGCGATPTRRKARSPSPRSVIPDGPS